MWTIAKYAFMERIHKKEFYIVFAIVTLVFLVYGSGEITVMVNGETLSDFENLFMVLSVTLFAFANILAFVISLRTIPVEYERGSSHLVWARGVSQASYHAGLTLSNVAASVLATFVFYAYLAVFAIARHRADCAARTPVSFLIACVGVTAVSLFTSVVSIRLSPAVAGLIGALFVAVGLLHRIVELYARVMTGAAGSALRFLLTVLPDLNGVGAQARRFALGQSVQSHAIWYGAALIYLLTLCFFIVRKESA